MDRQEFAELIKEVTGELLEKHLASVHEEITDVRTDLTNLREEMTEEFRGAGKEMQDGFVGLKSQIGALHNRIDNETFTRKDLESRIRKVVPNLPETVTAQ